jgi:hypothetical protein
MSGRTVSAYVDDATAASIAQIAKIEDRSPAQIGAAAFRLYAALPEVAHRALRRLDAAESPELSRQASNSMTRGLLHVLFDDAENRIVESMRRNGIGDNIGDSEDEILAEAVRLTTQPR